MRPSVAAAALRVARRVGTAGASGPMNPGRRLQRAFAHERWEGRAKKERRIKGLGRSEEAIRSGIKKRGQKGYRAKRWREASGVKAKIHRRRGWRGERGVAVAEHTSLLASVDRKTPCRERESRWSTCRPCGIGLWHGSSNALDLESERVGGMAPQGT